MKDVKYYVCKHCGNVAGKIVDSGVPMICCGEPMQELIPGVTDGTAEKHVPVLSREGKFVTVSVGSVEHPMLDAHYIMWITLVHGNRRETKFLNPGEKPVATFYCEEDDAVAFEYCNLHGLWKGTL